MRHILCICLIIHIIYYETYTLLSHNGEDNMTFIQFTQILFVKVPTKMLISCYVTPEPR